MAAAAAGVDGSTARVDSIAGWVESGAVVA